jgi:diguanylate cyclase (GGDEF)-like protein
MDRFRLGNEEFQAELADERASNQRRAGFISVGLIVVLSLLFGVLGYLLVERGAQAEARRRERHAHFADVLQLSRSEAEAYDVVKRHLEQALPDTGAFVLNRNNSADRLEPSSPVPEGSPLREALTDAEPESCLAIRIGAVHCASPDEEKLLVCGVCGKAGGSSTCVLSVVGGEVIGSVLLQHSKPLGRRDTGYVREAVAEAAPIVANLRNLALAEMRAATDLLTGLPNNRAAQETLKRMVAQADRTVTPLAAALFDLDHFKQINDTHGNGKGDEVLAAVGDAVDSGIRDGDFVGRYGGEEFLLLLPSTNREGALLVAEKLREAIARLTVPGVDRRITASFGVAVLPDDAVEATQLLRIADRALYSAKANGRDRVETPGRDEADPKPALRGS